MKKVLMLIVVVFLTTKSFAQLMLYQSENGNYGYKDASGNIMIAAQYKGATNFSSGNAFVVLNETMHKINIRGEIVITYSGSSQISDKVYAVFQTKNNTIFIGIINPLTGEEISPLKYNKIVRMSNTLLSVGINNAGLWSYGVLNGTTGKEIIPPSPKYNSIDYFDEHFLLTSSSAGNKTTKGLLDSSTGFEKLPPIYDRIYKSRGDDSFYNLVKDEKYGIFDITSENLIPAIYDNEIIFYAGSNPIPAVKDGKGGYIDKKGTVVIPFIYGNWLVDPFGDDNLGYVRIQKNGKYGVINNKGVEMVPFIYDYISISKKDEEGLIQAQMNGKWGFIDVNGRLVVPIIYDKVEDFHDGLAVVKLNGKAGYVNNTGKVVIPIIYRDAYSFSNGKGSVVIEKEEKITYQNIDYYTYKIDKTGKILGKN